MAEPSPAVAPYVFLSYASVEREQALQIAGAITRAGVGVWIDRQAITGGSSWSAEIVRGMQGAAAVLLLCSEAAYASPNVQRELNLAVEENRPLLPLLLRRAPAPAEIRYAIAGRQWIDVLERPEAAWLADVLRALQRLGIVSERTTAAPAAVAAQAARPPQESAAVHLPAPLTSFLGREQELLEVDSFLASTRLLTLTGPGGTGKTRLAIAVARQVADRYPDGTFFVDLSGVADPDGVLPAIAQSLTVRDSDGRSLAVSLAAYLRRKRLLLVLDNVEQVVAAAMALYDLLIEAPALSILCTSRVLLHVEGEREYGVTPLPLPPSDAAVGRDPLSTNPAVQLFAQRAQAIRAGFALTAENTATVAAICRRLDGLPLAIELAAARVKLLAPSQLFVRLEQRLAFLTGGERNRPVRQQTLRNTIQWSWDLLSGAEQLLFRRLGVFAGGFTLAAAEAVCNPGGELDVLEGLAALVDQSLVRQQEQEQEGSERFSLLATLQEFALEQLESSGETASLRRAHATYYCALADDADAAYWRSGRAQQDVVRPLEPERDNLFATLAWSLIEQDAAIGLRLGGALGPWFYIRAPLEGQQWLERLLALPEAAAPGSRSGRAVFGAALCAVARGEVPAAVAHWEEAVVRLRAEEDLQTLSLSLALLSVYIPASELDRVGALSAEALQLARTLGSDYVLAFVEAEVGMALLGHGANSAAARVHLQEALRLALPLDSDWVPMFALMNLAQAAELEGQNAEASALWHEALPLYEAMGDRAFMGYIRLGLAQLAVAAGAHDEAAEHLRTALLLAQDVGSAAAAAPCLAGVAGLLGAQQRWDLAVRLLAAAQQLREAAEQHPLHGPQFQAAFAPALRATRAALRAEAFAEAWASGNALTLDQAIDLALAELEALRPQLDSATAPTP